jgi:hypothetical protein
MKYFFLGIILLSFACNKKVQKVQSNNSDTIPFGVTTQEDNETISFDEIYKDFTKGYYQEKKIDTILLVNNEKYELKFYYHCLLDSSLIIPRNFYEGELKNDFITHNYAIEIQILKANEPIYKNELTKKAFEECITGDIKKYGALLYPYFLKYDNKTQSFIFGFSVSIPLTDIGRGVFLTIDLSGNAKYLSKI